MSGYIGTKAVTLSTTAANVGGDSTVGGDLTVDTNTLYVDSTNNRVGVGTASPSNPFQVGTSDLIVDSSGNVGIGTSSPSSYNANIDDLVVSNAASGGITIATGTTSQGAVAFADGTSGSSPVMGRIRYDHSVNEMDFRVNNSEAMRIDGSNRVMIATSTPETRGITLYGNGVNGMYVKTTSTTNYWITRDGQGAGSGTIATIYSDTALVGSISVSATTTSYNTTSDHRLKENVTDVTDGITRVKQLEPKRFNFIADPDTTVDGFLAHEAQSVVPEAVTGTHNEVDDDGNAVMQGIDQSKLVPLLTAALKESIAKIEALEARVTALEGN